VELARVLGDRADELVAGRRLSERLASRDVEIDAAIELATRTLATSEDAGLRHSLVGWLEGLGEPGLAASELRKLQSAPGSSPESDAQLLVRIGVLHARAGDPHGAVEAFSEAADIDGRDALSLELMGSIAGWAPEVVSPRNGAEAYVRAARRRAAAGEADAELEDLFRAFELDPSSPLATAALTAAHAARDRMSAADEVLRAHGAASSGEASAVNARRRMSALERGDLARALGAALDDRLDGVFDGPSADAIDELLVRAGAFEALAVRLEIRAERAAAARSPETSRRWADLGRLLAGPLASPERAFDADARALAADASDASLLHQLRSAAPANAERGEAAPRASSPPGAPGPFTVISEALLRAAMGEAAFGASRDASSRVAAARSLAEMAEEAGESLLAGWAYSVILEQSPDLPPGSGRAGIGDSEARERAARTEEARRKRTEEIAAAEHTLETSLASWRLEALQELARLLRPVPLASRRFAEVLRLLVEALPDDDAIFAEALRVAERVGDFAAVVTLLRGRIARGSAPRLRLALVAALRRAGEDAAAAAAASALFDLCTPWAYSVAWITAAATGDRATRARALAALAPTCSSQVVAVLAAVASEELAHVDEPVPSRRAAEQAIRADAHDARAIRALAAAVPAHEARVAATALDRAASVAGPSSALALRLAEAFEGLGDSTSALAWARRAVALRPSRPEVVQALVDCASRAGDAEALADALAWLLPQPQPARATAERLAPALETLVARDPGRAVALSRRALDILGPRHASLRAAVTRVAEAAKDAALGAQVVERWIAAGAPAAERGPLLLGLAAHHAAAGDTERELVAYVRAARTGLDLAPVRARIDAVDGRAETADAELAWLEARAELLLDEGSTEAAAATFRDLGAALWDTADDRPRALAAWLRAAQLDSERGYATLRRDLSAFADLGYAVDCLSELAEREEDRARAGLIATEAARAALEHGSYLKALNLARTALARHPSHPEALEIAERACEHTGRMQEMSPIYDQAARGALGRFGRRAAHHRAARFYELQIPMLALKHAAQAFIAVPSEGTTLGLLSRTADRAQRRSVAVRTVEYVAELARTQNLRAAWLLRAASLAGRDLEGARQRVDLLLKAAVLSAAPGTLSMLSIAARELVSLAPDDTEATAMRLERANESLAKGLEGPDGARIGISFADMALDLFSDTGWAWRAIERALDADADVDEYARLLPFADRLARDKGAGESLGRIIAACDKPFANVGVALLRLVGSVAAAMGDGPRSVRAYVQAAEKEPDDDELVAEVDAAVSANPDPGLIERLSKKVGVYRRSQALRAVAARKSSEGDHAAAVSTLERALAIAPNDAKPELAQELKAELERSGRGEEAVLRELAAPGITSEARAELWTQLAAEREGKGDVAGATDALLQAATDAPDAARWAAVERAAEASGRDHIRVQALQNLGQHVEGATRLAVQKRLARAEGARGSLAAAEEAWRKVWTLDPADGEADVAIEALLVARGDYGELGEHLGRRASRLADAGEKETLRAVRLRRAAILEQRLNRLDEAAAELEQLLRETPGHASALRWLADIYERAGSGARALPVLEQLAQGTTDPIEQEGIAVRRVRALIAGGDVAGARAVLTPYLERPSAAIMDARVALARHVDDPAELGAALEELARVSPDDPRSRSEMLVEAAQAAARQGESDLSLSRAREAARLAPDIAATQLFARGLEYRLRGAGSSDEAKETIGALGRLPDAGLEPEDVALRAFLLAEAEDVVTPGAGERTLSACLKEVGAQPLVELGLAERAAKGERFQEALRHYPGAVYGNLLGLRRPGRVALAAAEAAERADDVDASLRFFDEAAKDPETRLETLRRLSQSAFVTRDVARARGVLRGLADALEGRERAEALAQLARALFDSPIPAERIEADRTMREAIEVAPAELASVLKEQLGGYRSRPPSASSHPPSSLSRPPSGPMPAVRPLPTPPPSWSGRAAEPSGPPRAPVGVIPALPSAPPVMTIAASPETVASVRHPPLGVAHEPSGSQVSHASQISHASQPAWSPQPPLVAPPTASVEITAVSPGGPPDPLAHRVAEAREKLASGARPEAEKILSEALRDGSVAAADALDALLVNDPARSAVLLKVRRQAVELRPGDPDRLVALRDAARLDQNTNYVRAIDHVLRAFDAERGPVQPPPLSAQSTQPGMLTLLTRHSRELGGEVFGCLWEGAQTLFAKPATSYGMTGLERIVPGPMSALSRLYEVALRLLDTPRVALFHRRGTGPLELTVALLAAPTAILEGEAREDGRDVRWMLGHALASVMPQNALPLGLPAAEARALWEVLPSAFGPSGASKAVTLERSHAELADLLWQTLSPRAQRRLKELLASGETAALDLVVERAKQSGRRVGMFLTADFGHAARALLAEHPSHDANDLTRPGGLQRLCRDLPALADLFRLAVRPEYADARWHVPTPASMRFPFNSGGPPPV